MVIKGKNRISGKFGTDNTTSEEKGEVIMNHFNHCYLLHCEFKYSTHTIKIEEENRSIYHA